MMIIRVSADTPALIKRWDRLRLRSWALANLIRCPVSSSGCRTITPAFSRASTLERKCDLHSNLLMILVGLINDPNSSLGRINTSVRCAKTNRGWRWLAPCSSPHRRSGSDWGKSQWLGRFGNDALGPLQQTHGPLIDCKTGCPPSCRSPRFCLRQG